MPLMDHGDRPPSGDAWSRDAARQAFRAAFTTWLAGLYPGDWQCNRDHINVLGNALATIVIASLENAVDRTVLRRELDGKAAS